MVYHVMQVLILTSEDLDLMMHWNQDQLVTLYGNDYIIYFSDLTRDGWARSSSESSWNHLRNGQGIIVIISANQSYLCVHFRKEKLLGELY